MIELLKGIGLLFLNPVLYIGLIVTYMLGSKRVKQERKLFHIRVEDPMIEMKEYIVPSLLTGFVLSVMTGLLGLNVPFEFVLLAGSLSVIFSIFLFVRLLSPVYTVGLSFLIIFGLGIYGFNGIWDEGYFAFDQAIYPSIAVLVGLLLLAEGWLIRKRGALHASPLYEKGKRGMLVGAQKSKRIWLVPVLLFIPNGLLDVPGDFWPVFSFGETEWAPLVVPFFIGFSFKAKSTLLANIVQPLGRSMTVLGLIVLAISAAGYWIPYVSLAAVAAAIIGHTIIFSVYKSREENRSSFFTSSKNGLMILGILPESPAERMGLRPGELLTKVNGRLVYSRTELYEALQSNRAHCKLEIYDINDQIRLVQNALYEGDHHELGILAVESRKLLPMEGVQ